MEFEFEDEDEKFLIEELVNLFGNLSNIMEAEAAKGDNDWLGVFGTVLVTAYTYVESSTGQKYLKDKFCLPGKYSQVLADFNVLKAKYNLLAPEAPTMDEHRPDISDKNKADLMQGLMRIGEKLGLVELP